MDIRGNMNLNGALALAFKDEPPENSTVGTVWLSDTIQRLVIRILWLAYVGLALTAGFCTTAWHLLEFDTLDCRGKSSLSKTN